MLSVVAVIALAALPMLLPLLQYWRIMLLGECWLGHIGDYTTQFYTD